jgi:hypothetical protein
LDINDGDKDGWKAMRGHEWNRVTQSAWQCKGNKLMNKTVFSQAFSEMLTLLQQSNTELRHSTMRTILRFLVMTEPYSDTSWKLIRKIYKSKEYDITHIEVIALTSLILKRVVHQGVYLLTKPLYRYENFLLIIPNALTTVIFVYIYLY